MCIRDSGIYVWGGASSTVFRDAVISRNSEEQVYVTESGSNAFHNMTVYAPDLIDSGIYSDSPNTTVNGSNITVKFGTAGAYGIMLDGANASTITNNIIEKSDVAIRMIGTTNGTLVENNTVLRFMNNGILCNGNYNRIINNTIKNGLHAIYVSESRHNVLKKNTLHDNLDSFIGGTGIYMLNNINITASQNKIYINNYGIRMYNVNSSTVYGNEINSSDILVYIDKGNYNNLTQNTLWNCTGTKSSVDSGCITLSQSNHNTLSHDMVNKSINYSIYVHPDSDHNNITMTSNNADVADAYIAGDSNRISGTLSSSSGVVFDGAGKKMYLSGNLLVEGTGINITGHNSTVDCLGNSILSDSLDSGIYSNQYNTTIRSCNISMGRGLSSYGIMLDGANVSSIINNTLQYQHYGLYVSGNNCTVANNIARGNTVAGIAVQSGTGNTITKNNISYNAIAQSSGIIIATDNNNASLNALESNDIGIWISGAYNTFEDNELTGCQGGIYEGCIHIEGNNAHHNTFIGGRAVSSNDYNVRVDGYGSNLFKDMVLTGAGLTDVIIDDQTGPSENNTFLNCTYDSEDTTGTIATPELIRKWYYRAFVNTTAGNYVDGATITMRNASGTIVGTLTTNGTGWTPMGSLTDYRSVGGQTYHETNHTVTAAKLAHSTEEHEVNVTATHNTLFDWFTMELLYVFGCRVLNSPNTVYTMNESIDEVRSSDCIIIDADNVTLDCLGHSIDTNAAYTAVYANHSNTTVRSCTLQTTTSSTGGFGIELVDADGSYIFNNTVQNNFYGIYLVNTDHSTLYGNIINGNYNQYQTTAGVWLEGSNNNTIYRNSGQMNRNAVLLSSSSDNNISRNDLNTNHYNSIALITNSNNNTIADNLCSYNFGGPEHPDSSGSGILLWASSDNVVYNNTANECLSSGIVVQNGAHNNMVYNNTANDNKFGIRFFSEDVIVNDCNDNLFENNTANSNSQWGMGSTRSRKNTYNNNTLIGNPRGMRLDFSPSYSNVTNNHIDDSYYNGIYISGGYYSYIINNTIKDSDDNIYSEASTGARFIGNRISGGDRGIYIVMQDNNVIRDNIITGSSDCIYLGLGSDGGYITGNKVSQCTNGININDGSTNTLVGNVANDSIFGYYIHDSVNYMYNNTAKDNWFAAMVSGFFNHIYNLTAERCVTAVGGCVYLIDADYSIINVTVNTSQQYGVSADSQSTLNNITVNGHNNALADVYIEGDSNRINGTFHSHTGALMAGTGTLYLLGNSSFSYHGINITGAGSTLDMLGYVLDGSDVTYSNGVKVDGANGVTVKNGIIENFDFGALIDSAQNTNVSNVVMRGGSYGLMLNRGSGNNIERSTATDNYMHGIRMESSDGNTITSSNLSSNNGDLGSSGLYMNHSSNNAIEGNVMENNWYGIYAIGGSDGNNISFVESRNNMGSYDVFLSDANNTMVKGTFNSTYGIMVQGDDTTLGFYGTATFNKNGISIAGHNAKVDLSGHVVYGGSDPDSIFLYSASMPRENTTLTNGGIQDFGHAVWLVDSGNANISSLSISGTNHSIVVKRSPGANIENVTIDEPGSNNYGVWSKSLRTTVRNCTIRKDEAASSSAAIFIENVSESVLYNNNVTGRYGILLFSTNNSRIYGLSLIHI